MIDINKIKDGALDGQDVWICDYRYSDYSNGKPIRSVAPTKVRIRSNEETKKRIYYSESHFVELNKKGDVVNSKIKGLFDNTGYRTYPGVPLNVFNTESECVDHYNELVKAALKGLKKHRKNIVSQLDIRIDLMSNLIK